MKRLGEKGYTLTLIGIIVALFVMVTYNYMIFHSNATRNIEEIGSSSLTKVVEELEAYLNQGMNSLQTTAISLEYIMDQGTSAKEIENYLLYESERYQKEVDKNFTGIYGVFQGTYIDGIGWTPDGDYDPTTREWYTAAVEANGKEVLVSPYLDAQTNTIMISISKLLSDGESVLSLDIGLDQIQKITEEICLNDIGYGLVVEQNGLVVAHKDADEKGKNYLQEDSGMSELLKRASTSEKSCFKIHLDGEKATVFSGRVLGSWQVFMIVNDHSLFEGSRITLQRNIMICGTISGLIILFFVLTFVQTSKSLEREKNSNRRIEEMNEKIIRALVRTIDAKDHYTNGHSLRVAEYSREIARRMKKSPKEQMDIYYAGLLHDVGKIRVPGAVINKPGKLTDEEYEQIKVHPVTSYHILRNIYEDTEIAVGAKFHHERYDGKGYPNGLRGENIPEIARIIGVADTYDAMASNRSYRKALPQDVVRSEIEKGKGTQLDPEIADIMLEMIDEDKAYSMKETSSNLKRILVVDDDPMSAKKIELIMEDEPMYEIIGAVSGKIARELLETQEISLILLDMRFPERDGFEIVERIKERFNIPIVFMTNDKNIGTMEKATEYGVEDYLTKPFMPLYLKEIMHSILS